MKKVETDPRIHIFVCVHDRSKDSKKPSCAPAGGMEVFDYLKEYVIDTKQFDIWVTKTGCLGWCTLTGATVAIYPEGVVYRDVSVEDLDILIETHLE